MFDLEQSIADWRKQMFIAGIKTPVPLEELENHLREEIERQVKSGLNGQAAFNSAIKKIGSADRLQQEFQKTIPLTVAINRILAIVVGIAAIVVGLFQTWMLVVQSPGLDKLAGDGFQLRGMFTLAFILAISLVSLGLTLALHGAGLSCLSAKRKT